MDMPVAHIVTSVDGLAAVLKSSRAGFDVQRVPSQQAPDWRIEGGALQHRSGGFFSVNGFKDRTGESVLLFQPQAAVTGVLMARVKGEPVFLLQARAEPGCLAKRNLVRQCSRPRPTI